MTNLEKLKAEKNRLQNEVNELQELLTFRNPKESLSELTNGLSDNYIKEKKTEDGHVKLGLKASPVTSLLAENALKFGSAAVINRIGKKTMNAKSWKYKILGLILVYVAPFVIKKIGEKLNDFQKRETAKGMSKLI